METVSNRPISIIDDPERICFNVGRGCSARVAVDLINSRVTFQRVGSSESAEYGIHESLSNGTLCVIVEEDFHKMRRGRWRASVLIADECCTTFDLDIGRQCLVSNISINAGGCC